MTQMPLNTPATTTTLAPVKRGGAGKLACLVTLVAGIALITTVTQQFGHVAFSASLALWALGFLLTLAGFLPGRKKGLAFLALLMNIGIGAWFVMSLNG